MTNSSHGLTDCDFSAFAIVRLPSDDSIVKQRGNMRESRRLCATPFSCLPHSAVETINKHFVIQEPVALNPW
jgi:hypothetical protein